MKSMGKRQAKAVETKKKIYESAERLFTKHGYDHVSVDAIVESAGVAKGSFYVHFDSKNALVTALIADYLNGLELNYKSYMGSLPAGAPASLILHSLAGKIAEIMAEIVGYERIRIIYEVQLTREINTDVVLNYNREIYKLFTNTIRLGIQQGEFKAELPAEVIAKHCVMSLRGLTYEWCIRHPDFNLQEQVQTHFEMLLSGIKRA